VIGSKIKRNEPRRKNIKTEHQQQMKNEERRMLNEEGKYFKLQHSTFLLQQL